MTQRAMVAIKCWVLRNVPTQEAADAFLEEFHFESRRDYIRKLARSLKRYGLRNPVIFGPQGLEGHHRIAAVRLLGWKYIPAYVSRPVSILDTLLDVDDLKEPNT